MEPLIRYDPEEMAKNAYKREQREDLILRAISAAENAERLAEQSNREFSHYDRMANDLMLIVKSTQATAYATLSLALSKLAES